MFDSTKQKNIEERYYRVIFLDFIITVIPKNLKNTMEKNVFLKWEIFQRRIFYDGFGKNRTHIKFIELDLIQNKKDY